MQLTDEHRGMFRRALELVDDVFLRAQERIAQRQAPIEARKVQVFFGLMRKAERTSSASMTLLEHGYDNEAHALQRCLLEVTLNLLWLADDENMDLVNRYHHHCEWQRKKLAVAASAFPTLNLDAHVPTDHEDQVNARARADLADSVWRAIKKAGGWIPDPNDPLGRVLSPEQACGAARAPELYALVFRNASFALHANDYGEYAEAFAHPQENSAGVRPVSPKWGDAALAGVFVLLPNCAKALIHQFNTGHETELEELESDIRRLLGITS